MASSQDWNTIVFHKKPDPPAPTGKDKEKHISEALRTGSTSVVTVKKATGGTNKKPSSDPAHLRAIDDETEDFHIPKVSLSVGKKIQQARVAKGWTQKELAGKINEKAQVVNSYENGTAVPTPAVMTKLSRTLGVQLSERKKKPAAAAPKPASAAPKPAAQKPAAR